MQHPSFFLSVYDRPGWKWAWRWPWAAGWRVRNTVSAHTVGTGSSSAIVAKLLSAFASHSGTPFVPFHPVVALRALLELGPFHKVYEVLVLLVESVAHAIFCAGHPVVISALAAKTVVFAASWAAIVVQCLVKLKGSCASCCWTPSYRAILLDELIEAELFEFFLEIWIRILVNIADLDSQPTTLHRAEDFSLSTLNFGAEVGPDTLWMEDVAALKDAKVVAVDFSEANWAFPALGISIFCPSLILKGLFLEKFLEEQLVLPILFLYSLLVLPFIIQEMRVDQGFLSRVAHRLQHPRLFFPDLSQSSIKDVETINNYQGDCLFLYGSAQIKLLDHLKFFLEVKNEAIIERQIDFSEDIPVEGLDNIIPVLEINEFEQLLNGGCFLVIGKALGVTFLPKEGDLIIHNKILLYNDGASIQACYSDLMITLKLSAMVASLASFKIKYIQVPQTTNMQAVAVVNRILDHILKDGKDIMHDRFLNRQKVPVFANAQAHSYHQQTVLQNGFQVASPTRNNYLSIPTEKQPQSLPKDHLCSKPVIQKQIVNQNVPASPDKAKTGRRNYSSSGIRHKKIKSVGFAWAAKELRARATEKQNQLIKLQQDHGKRRVIEKAVQRESMEENRLRQEKQMALLKQYQVKKVNEMLENDRLQERLAKEKQFQQHTSRGYDHKFVYHEGQIIFFKHQDPQAKAPKQTVYQLQEDPQSGGSQQEPRYAHGFARNNPKALHHLSSQPTEPHRIRSARGEAFASSVLKTINLSRVSLNETLRNLEDDQFMKRNDLFNNNHARQTTSIPYLLPKSGTVYTELSTNQTVENRCQTERKESCSMKSETTRNPISSKRLSHFEPYIPQDLSNYNKWEKPGQCLGQENSSQFLKIKDRCVRTAEGARQSGAARERRPHTSVSKGRITRGNGELVLSLLQ